MRILKFAAAIGAGVIALGVTAYAYFLYSPDPTPPHLSGQVQTATIQVGSRLRSYVEYIPAQLPAGAPLVIALHGTTMDGALMRKFTGYEFDSIADTHGFAVFYPDGYKTNWNDCLKAGAAAATLEHVDDVGFILALIGKAQSEFKIDPKKVYLVGYSNGGQLAMTLATLSPGPAASIAVFGADLPTPDNSTCSQDSRTPPIMIVGGTDDPISPYNGGEVSIFGFQNKGTVVSAPATAEAFARRNGIGTPPSEEMLPHRDPRDPTSVQRLTWWNQGEPYVVLYTIRGGGHTVPQPVFRYPRLLGRTTGDLDGPTQAIAFFHL
jgi:polyhydroxybutyrate depolymerase